MAVHYRTPALVIKKKDRGEADQILTILTQEFGKLQVLGKAVRKIKSKLRASSELFCFSEIEFIQGKSLKTLTDTLILDNFGNLRKSPERMKIAFRIAEVSDQLVKGEEKDKKLWRLILEVFKRLDSSSISGFLVYYYFLWNLFSVLGYQVDFYHCSCCQKKLNSGKLYFNPEEGIACPSCFKQGQEISSEAIKVIRLFIDKDWNILAKLKIPEEEKKEIALISEAFLSSI